MVVIDLALAGWALSYAVVVATALVRRPAKHSRAELPLRIMLVRPCTGQSRWLASALTSLPPDWPSAGRVMLTVADAEDPAYPIARIAAATLRASGVDAEAVVAATPGQNRKVAQLSAAHERYGAQVDLVLVADADVDLRSLDLGALAGALAPDVAAAWVPPVELDARSLGDFASRAVSTSSLHAFPLLATLDRELLVGKLFAVRAPALAHVGGFAELVDRLGEDAELAARLHRAKLRVVAVDARVRSIAIDRGLREVLDRYLRWALVLRWQRPLRLLSYPFLVSAMPLVVGLGLWRGTPLAMAAAGLALASRLLLAVVAARRCGRTSDFTVLTLEPWVADAMLLVAFVRACFTRSLRWRDRALRLGPRGRLQAQSVTIEHDCTATIEQAR